MKELLEGFQWMQVGTAGREKRGIPETVPEPEVPKSSLVPDVRDPELAGG